MSALVAPFPVLLTFQREKTLTAQNSFHTNPPSRGSINDKPSTEGDPVDSLFLSLRPLLLFGKFIGLVPIQGLFQRDVNCLSFQKWSFSAVGSIIASILVGGNACSGLFAVIAGDAGSNAADYAFAPAPFLFFTTALCGYIRFYRHTGDLIQIFRQWNGMKLVLTVEDKTLRRDANLVVLILLSSAISENIMSSMGDFLRLPSINDLDEQVHQRPPKGASSLQIHYIRAHENWAEWVPYHPVIAIYAMVSTRLAWYTLNVLDLTVILHSRALYFRFKALYLEGRKVLIGFCNTGVISSSWKDLVRDHTTLCDMMSEINEFLSPIIFASYGLSLYQTCLTLHATLTPSARSSALEKFYHGWAFLHLLSRILLVSLSAAWVSSWAHKSEQLFRKCPKESFSTEVMRTERYLSSRTIGFTGLDCFVVTKPFILQIISVVFTFEIVLLQASQTPLDVSNPANTCECTQNH